jgi:chaperone modulatory protein CbpM
MIDEREFLALVRIDAQALGAWIEAGWLMPRRDTAGWTFSEIDLARAQLFSVLKHDFGLNDEGVAVALDLLDQIYGLRRALRELLSGVYAQPESMRRRIATDIRESAGSDRLREVPPTREHPNAPGPDTPA